MLDVLAWLWDTVAEPVLDAPGYTESIGAGGPPLLWCPSGGMSLVPLHAAGHHEEAGQGQARNAPDRVVSSYTVSLRALGYAKSAGSGSARSALIVGMPDTPRAAPLPGVEAEVSLLTGLLKNADVLQQLEATHDAVLEELPKHAIAHFACHCQGDAKSPGESRLLLHDHLSRPLTVSAISQLSLPDAAFAYLSACETSVTAPALADEAIHLTGAFQLAGDPHVIGTLWPVHDGAALRITTSVYQEMASDGGAELDVTSAALALHNAVRALRARCRGERPSWWAAHVDLGH